MDHSLFGYVIGFVCTAFGYLVALVLASGRIDDIRREQMEASNRWSTEYAALQNKYYALVFKSGEVGPMYDVRTCSAMPPPDAANLAGPAKHGTDFVPGTTYTQKQWDAMQFSLRSLASQPGQNTSEMKISEDSAGA
jgi:hypothetical protein